MLTIFFIPGYAMFIWLFKEHIAGKDLSHRYQEMAQLLLTFSIIAIISYLAMQALYQFSPEAQGHWNANVPNSLQFVIGMNTVCLFSGHAALYSVYVSSSFCDSRNKLQNPEHQPA